MKRIILGVRYLLPVGMVLMSPVILAATNYVVPWYANPVSSDVAFGTVPMMAFDDDAAMISAAWTAVENADALSGKTVAAKCMSHTTYFRPRLYVLCGNGDVVVFTLTKELDAIKWTTPLLAANLAAAAGVAEGSKATDIIVADDGAYCFLKYGEVWKTLGYDPPHWKLYILDKGGNPATTPRAAQDIWNSTHSANSEEWLGTAYITDGKWKFQCHRNASTQIVVGNFTATDQNHIVGNLDDCSAEYLDLSRGTAVPGDSRYANLDSIIDNNVYELQIRGNYKGAFADRMRVYIGTCNQSFWYNSRGNWENVEEAVESSEIATTLSYRSSISASVKRHVLSFPALRYTTSNGKFSNTGATETDFGDWDFSALTNAGSQVFCNAAGKGVLSLPAIVSTTNVATASEAPFCHCGAEEIHLSAEGRTLEVLGSRTFRNAYNLKRIVIGGKAGGFKFDQAGASTTMFPDSEKLVDIVFTGGHPVFTDPGLKVFGTRDGDSKRCNMVFAHPTLDDPTYGAEWAEFLSGKAITPLALAERRAFQIANPGRPVPYGVADKSIFLTTYDQYIAITGSENEDLGVAPVIEWDAAQGDSVAISGATEVEPGSGVYPAGSTLLLTAVPGSTGTFVRWYGDIGDNNPSSGVIRVEAADDMWLFARFVHPWTVTLEDVTSGTAFNGNVRINVTDVDSATKTLTVGKNQDHGLYVVEYVDNGDDTVSTNMTGSGVVDLGGDFLVNGEKYTVTRFANSRSSMVPPPGSSITTFISPGTLTSYNGCSFYGSSSFNGKPKSEIRGTPYATAILDEPGLTKKVQTYLFGDNAVERFVAILPNIADWTPLSPFWNISAASTRLDWWDLRTLSATHPQVFQTQYLKSPSGYVTNHPLYAKRLGDASGTLSMPSLRSVDTNFGDNSVAAGSPLMIMTGVEGFVLGGATTTTTVTNIGDRAFAGDSALRSLTIHADAGLVVGTNLFADQWGYDGFNNRRGANGQVPERIVFTGEAISAAAMDNLLAGVCAATEKPVKVYVDRRNASWKTAAYIDRDCSRDADAQAAALAGEKVLGVIRCGAPAPLGKALVIHLGSPYYRPPDFRLSIR